MKRHVRCFPAAGLVALAAAVLVPACQEPPFHYLFVNPNPRTLDGSSGTSELKIEALSVSQGGSRQEVGRGVVVLRAEAGAFTDSGNNETSVDLTEGSAAVTFGCNRTVDPACTGPVEVVATWSGITTTVVIQVLAENGDGGTDGGANGSAACGPTFAYDELVDWVLFDRADRFLVINRTLNSVDVLDMATQRQAGRVVVGGSPARIVYSAAINSALVVHGPGGVTRADLVDMATSTDSPIDLLFAGTSYEGRDVAFGPAGTGYVLAQHGEGYPRVILEIDLAAKQVRGLMTIGISTTDHWKLLYRDGVFFVGNVSLKWATAAGQDGGFDGGLDDAGIPSDAGAGSTWDLVLDNSFPSAWFLPNKLQLAADGKGYVLNQLQGKVIQFDPSRNNVITATYALLPFAILANDVSYSHTGRWVATLNDVNQNFWVQLFDRVSGAQILAKQVGDWNLGNADIGLMVLSGDDTVVYLYASQPSYGRSEVMCTVLR